MVQGFEGRIYHMFMLDYGHTIKVSEVTANIPCINKGVKSKLKVIQNNLYKIKNNNITTSLWLLIPTMLQGQPLFTRG